MTKQSNYAQNVKQYSKNQLITLFLLLCNEHTAVYWSLGAKVDKHARAEAQCTAQHVGPVLVEVWLNSVIISSL